MRAGALQQAIKLWLTPFASQWRDRLARVTRLLEGTPQMTDFQGTLRDFRKQVESPAAHERVFAAPRHISRWWTSPFQPAADARASGDRRLSAYLQEAGRA